MGDAAMTLLKEEFKDVDIRSKKRAAERLQLVAKALGVERTRKELIPWLTELIGNSLEDDEVLYLIADQLGGMNDLAGGSKYSVCLLEPLEKLCKVEETIVRDRAVEATIKLASSMKKDAIENSLVAMVQRLAGGDWFTARVSACGLICDTMKRCSSTENRNTLKETYAKLAGDETPMVRRAAAKVIHKVAKHTDSSNIASDVLPIFKSLAKDTQDAVRLNAIGNSGDLAKLMTDTEVSDMLMPTITLFARDRSWRVRFTVGKNFGVFADKVAKKNQDKILPVFLELAKDPEGEVRRTAIRHVPTFAEILGGDTFTGNIYPVIKELVETDGQNIVRLSLAEACVNLLSKVPTAVAKTYLKPMLEQFLITAPVNTPEIRLAVLSGLGKIAAVVGADVIVNQKDGWGKTLYGIYESSKAKSVQEQMTGMEDVEHPQWRLRRAIVSSLDKLAKNSGAAGESFIVDIWTRALADEVKEVRISAADALQDFTSSSSHFGKDKVVKLLVPALNEFYVKNKGQNGGSANYLNRIIFLHCFFAVRKHQEVWKLLLPNVEGALSDPVANVKIGALKAIAESIPDMGTKNAERFRSQVQGLTKDQDSDIAFWAQQALMNEVL